MGWDTHPPISNQQPLGDGGARATSGESFERVFEAGQRLLSDRLNLLKIELRDTLHSSAKSGVTIAAGLVLAAIGGGILLAALVAVLLLVLPLWGALAAAGAGCFLTGAGMGLWGRSMIRQRTQLRAAAQERHGLIHPLESAATSPALPKGDGQKWPQSARLGGADQPQTLKG